MRALHSVSLVLILPWFAGCAGTSTARYVYQDGEFGVVGIPENTDRWPTHYRRKAESLMASHFPEGHEIVRAEEVVEGTRTLTVQGSNNAELSPKIPTALLSVGSLGLSSTRSQADNVKIKECRIIYRRARRPVPSNAYAEVATLTPVEYVDPNAPERRKESKKAESEHTETAKKSKATPESTHPDQG